MRKIVIFLATLITFIIFSSCSNSDDQSPSLGDDQPPSLSGITIPVSGRVLNDSPISNAPIYLDASGDGRLGTGDTLVTTTGSLGEFEGEIPIEYASNYLISYGSSGTDIGNPDIDGDESRLFFGQWRAPASSRVISPMTELQILLKMKDSEFQDFLASSRKLKGLSFDHYTFDPYGDTGGSKDDRENKILSASESVSRFFEARADRYSISIEHLQIEIRRVLGDNIPLQEILQINALQNQIPEGVTSRMKLADITIDSSVLASIGGETTPILVNGFKFFEIESIDNHTWELYLKSGKILDSSVLTNIRANITPSVFNYEENFFVEPPYPTSIDFNITSSDADLSSIEIDIYENHPINKEVYRVNSEGTISLTDAYGDNSLFRLDSKGRIWWIASPDFETKRDSDDNNIYEIEVTQTAMPGQSSTKQISVRVNNIDREESLENRNARFGSNWYRFSKEDIESFLPDNSYHFYLYGGEAYAMPSSGPLVLTWSIVLPDADVPPWYRNYDEDGNWGEVSSLSGYIVTSTQHSIDRQRALFQNIIDMFEQIMNVKFIEVSDTRDLLGDIRVVINHPGARGIAYPFSTYGGDMLTADMTTAKGFSTAAHELGHLLGLKHPFESAEPYGGSPDFLWGSAEKYVPKSIMSYSVPYQKVLSQNDIAALQFLYGAPGTHFTGLEPKFSDPVVLCTPSEPTACYD